MGKTKKYIQFLIAALIVLYSIRHRFMIAESGLVHVEEHLEMSVPKEIVYDTQEKTSISPPQIFAQSAVLIDGKTGRVLYGKAEDTVLPMASTTKIMTCILALENANMDDVVRVSDYAASMPDVQLNIRTGETYYLKDLLYSLMLESHNDTAVAIAEHVAGNVERFAEMMNQKARDIGCENTTFITPNGLDGTDSETGKIHATTAKELARIMLYCISQSPKKEEFLMITRSPSHTFGNLERTRSFSCVNHNALLTWMDGAVSGKTGFTNKAGYCYVGAVEKEDRLYIAAVLACGWPPHKTYKWQDMKKLISYGNEAFDYYEVERKEIRTGKIPVENGVILEADTEIRYSNVQKMTLLMQKEEPVTIKKAMARSISAPMEAGTPVGYVEYYVSKDKIASYPIVITEAIELWNLDFCRKRLLKQFLFCYNLE